MRVSPSRPGEATRHPVQGATVEIIGTTLSDKTDSDGRFLIENVSLIGNYRSQFDRIIRTSSYDDLVRRLKDRALELSDKAAKPARPPASAPR